jgi:mRNA interferase MazF
MPSMTAYNFGDVVLVPFPFTDQSQAKQRPAVVVSSARYNTERPDLILMAVTSQVRSPATFGEIVVQHWQAAQLLKLSAIGKSISRHARMSGKYSPRRTGSGPSFWARRP